MPTHECPELIAAQGIHLAIQDHHRNEMKPLEEPQLRANVCWQKRANLTFTRLTCFKFDRGLVEKAQKRNHPNS